MRRANKINNSKILIDNLKYRLANSNNNIKIANILFKEQNGFCSYTDEYLSRTDAKDIEHFNPNLKGTEEDNYNNWFLVKHQWNKEKNKKWDNFQPILDPISHDFEERIIYIDCDYFAESDTDIPALNLIKLLNLDDAVLASKRKKYISRSRKNILAFNLSPQQYFTELIEDDVCHISYTRAIKEEFGIDVFSILDNI